MHILYIYIYIYIYIYTRTHTYSSISIENRALWQALELCLCLNNEIHFFFDNFTIKSAQNYKLIY